ncbi:ORC-CDC6 family AAA ATPase [Dietzia cinnamea]|uniref:ORC-CDC6 family AAA ATPase n=1 Tax=Dietzia cinnamea TaxID=321318 RepID=UPI00223A8964|nr:hypothetical protein [Dietzia cinnamea]MCT2175835.1 hypothetical protein [Dietzia cinnamea]
MTDDTAAIKAQRLNEVFGGLRAEYFRDEIYDLFATPTYWPELLTRRPCLLVGGRGTGKTTALRGLSYEGLNYANEALSEWTHVGLYWRIDTNTVRAFRGASLPEEDWVRYFSHYINIVLAQLLVDFLRWAAESKADPVDLDSDELDRCCRALLIAPVAGDLRALASSLDNALIDFETAINNIGGAEKPNTSVLGRPITYMTRAMSADRRIGTKPIFFLVDEYENFEDYQQRVFNTLIKHAGDQGYTFKIGMKSMGHRERATTNPNEILVQPADYALIDIADRLKGEGFGTFAKSVCTGRLRRISDDLGEIQSMEELLPSLSAEAEAEELGVSAKNKRLRERLEAAGADAEELAHFDEMPPLAAYMVEFWARAQESEELEVLRFAQRDAAAWGNRLNNYQHSAIYTLRRGRRGIRKYYAGWNTFVLLAAGNIRFLLELVNEALQEHLAGHSLETPVGVDTQTKAAQAVGQRHVEQLQGLSAQGANLTRLVLSMGRVFQVMAAEPEGHTPEVSQFRMQGNMGEPYDQFAEEVITSAVMHLAVLRFPGDKMAGTSGETRDYDYQLHPIFAPFFVFSYRSKRRMEISSKDLYGLVRQPRSSIREVLERSRRTVPEDLPDQLSLFEEYFQ